MREYETVNILLVDDDDVAVETMMRAFRRARIVNPIHRAKDGVDAFEVLRGTGGRDPLPRPHIVLLDLRMPRMDGLRFLETLRSDPDLGDTVVFMLSTSREEKDRHAAYERHVAGYIVKSELEDGLEGLVELLSAYWRVVELPREAVERRGSP